MVYGSTVNLTETSLCSASTSAAATSSTAIAWDAQQQGAYVTSLTAGLDGSIYVGTEGSGIWGLAADTDRWKEYTCESTSGGLGDDDIYSLCCDHLGRLWCGTGRDGVSVFNGASWRTYDRLDGPLGCHVVALTVSPSSGDVWGCTEAGLFRYVVSTGSWRYYTRSNGLPTDQSDSITISTSGVVTVGTLCSGLAFATPSDDYALWHTVSGDWYTTNDP